MFDNGCDVFEVLPLLECKCPCSCKSFKHWGDSSVMSGVDTRGYLIV